MKFVLAILILSVVILFHELGHFLLAKANHITVYEFAFGMGPKILSFTRGETTYAWRLLPFGGSCTMMGEDEEEDAEGSFNHAPVWGRISVIAAGPLFNFLMAFLVSVIVVASVGSDPARVTEVAENTTAAESGLQAGDLIVSYQGNGIANARELFTDVELDGVPEGTVNLVVERDGEKKNISYDSVKTTRWLLGYYYDAENTDNVTITGLVDGSAMAEAGFQAGDVITSIGDHKVTTLEELTEYWSEHPLDGTTVTVTADRNGSEYSAEVTPTQDTSTSLGFSLNSDREKMGFLNTLKYSFGEMKYWVHVTIKSLASLIGGQYGVKDLSGPVGVVNTVGQVYDEVKDEGSLYLVMTMLNFVILLSANLGVMNLLPLPALDGGRLVFLLLEAVRGKPVNRKVEGYVHFAGLMILMALMVFVMYNDISKIIAP